MTALLASRPASLPSPSGRHLMFLRRVALASLLIFAFLQVAGALNRLATTELARIRGEALQSTLEDYVAFYAGGRLVREGRGDELYDVEAIGDLEHEIMGRPVGGTGVLTYFNPPYVAAVFAPLAGLPIGAFSASLFAIDAVLILGAGIALDRLLRPTSRAQRLWLWLGYLSFHATYWMLLQQQLSIFVLLGWLGFLSFHVRGNEKWSGASLALALVKPQMVVVPVLVLLLQGRWQTLRALATVAGCLLAVSLLAAGPGIVVEYPRFLLDSTSWEQNGVFAKGMFGFNGFLATVTGMAAPPLLLVALLAAPVVAGVLWAVRALPQNTAGQVYLFGGLQLTASLLINPHLYEQDLILLCLALALGAAHAKAASGSFSLWPHLALVTWFILFRGVALQAGHGIPVITPWLLCLYLTFFLIAAKQGRTRQSAFPALNEKLAA